MGRVVVVGSINADLVVTAARLPGPGETVAGTGLSRSGGGKGANQAAAAARAGAPTAMVGCVGDDEAGERLVAELFDAGVDVAGVVVVPGVPTGTAVVTVADGENTIVVVPGANAHVTAEALGVGAGDVVVAQNEVPLAATTVAFAAARAAGATTVLNPAPAVVVPPDLLALTDHLVVNEHEVAVALAGRTGPVVHLTLGAVGVEVTTAEETFRVAGHPVEVVDPTGAGDCYVGTLAAGLASGVDLPTAVERANRAAAASVTRAGAR